MKVTINMNDEVVVQLTGTGLIALNKHCEDHKYSSVVYRVKPSTPVNLFRFTLWELANIFGVYNGCDIPFIDNVITLEG